MVDKALSVEEAHLDLPLDPSDPAFPVVLRVRQAAAQTILQTQRQVDDQKFRQAKENKIPALLARLKEVKAKLDLLPVS
jgi:hypothetical protein